MKRALLRVVICCAAAMASPARAEDIWSLRPVASVHGGPHLLAWDAGLGIAWDTYVDKFGVRLGSDLTLLSYPNAHAAPGLLAFTPEVSVFFGDEVPTRVYYTLQIPTRAMPLESRYTREWTDAWWLGIRGGVELEQRFDSANLRLRGGLFAGLLRDETGKLRPSLGVHVALEYGKKSVPPMRAAPNDRTCADGTPKLWNTVCK
ncbi:MAG TPA: hypothetical protein VHM19_12780 [Polyangiales bacterium]|nr:hypothetical protein [Polyangiales bacterium]